MRLFVLLLLTNSFRVLLSILSIDVANVVSVGASTAVHLLVQAALGPLAAILCLLYGGRQVVLAVTPAPIDYPALKVDKDLSDDVITGPYALSVSDLEYNPAVYDFSISRRAWTTSLNRRSGKVIDRRPLSMRNCDLTHTVYDVDTLDVIKYQQNPPLAWLQALSNILQVCSMASGLTWNVLAWILRFVHLKWLAQVLGNGHIPWWFRHKTLSMDGPLSGVVPGSVKFVTDTWFSFKSELFDQDLFVHTAPHESTWWKTVHDYLEAHDVFEHSPVVGNVLPVVPAVLTAICALAAFYYVLYLIVRPWLPGEEIHLQYLPYWLHVLVDAVTGKDVESSLEYVSNNGLALMARTYSVNLDPVDGDALKEGTLKAAVLYIRQHHDQNFSPGCTTGSPFSSVGPASTSTSWGRD